MHYYTHNYIDEPEIEDKFNQQFGNDIKITLDDVFDESVPTLVEIGHDDKLGTFNIDVTYMPHLELSRSLSKNPKVYKEADRLMMEFFTEMVGFKIPEDFNQAHWMTKQNGIDRILHIVVTDEDLVKYNKTLAKCICV